MSPEQKIDKLIHWIRKTTPKEHGLLVPISGGSDSALMFWLCNKALPKKTLGVFARSAAASDGRAGKHIRAEEWFASVGKIKKIKPPEASENIEVMRWAKFLEMNLKEKRVLVGTRNRTEDSLGTYSLASRAAAFFPIVGLWKSEVVELCEYIGVPEEVILSSRRADPVCGRPQKLADIPIALLDAFLQVKTGELKKTALRPLTRTQLSYLERLYAQNEFKKTLPVKGPWFGVEKSAKS